MSWSELAKILVLFVVVVATIIGAIGACIWIDDNL